MSSTVEHAFGRPGNLSTYTKLAEALQQTRGLSASLPQPGLHAYGLRTGAGGMADSVRNIALDSSILLSSQLRTKIKEITKLKLNWDNEGARPVKPYVLADAVETLNRLRTTAGILCEPYLVPTFDGYVQMEWHGANRSLDIEAVEKGWHVTATETGTDGYRRYYTAECDRSDFDKIDRYYQWVIGNELLIWPF